MSRMKRLCVLRARIVTGVFAVAQEILGIIVPFVEVDFSPPDVGSVPDFVSWADYVRDCGMSHPPRTMYLRLAGPCARITGTWDQLPEGRRFAPDQWWLERSLKDFVVHRETRDRQSGG